jgi:hypothetical protein
LLSYLTRRAGNITGTFANFLLQATGYRPGYQTVQRIERNEIEFYGNVTGLMPAASPDESK